MTPEATPEALVGLLAEPARMRVFAAVVLGAHTPAEVAARTGLELRAVVAALRRLTDGALVTSADGRLEARLESFKEATRAVRPGQRPAAAGGGDARAAVLRAFVANGTLTSI